MISRFLSFIRFSHTIFALPFALGSMFVAAHGLPAFRVFALVVLAMVFARTAAMTFNRLADWEIDKRNPRTAGRHQLVSKSVAAFACLVSASLFVATAWLINPLCFALSPVALVIVPIDTPGAVPLPELEQHCREIVGHLAVVQV